MLFRSVYVDGYEYYQRYERGKVMCELQKIGPTEKRGTTVHFLPDKEIFEETVFDDYGWDDMYYHYMKNIEHFPFLKEVGMSECASLYYVKKSQFEEELTKLGVDFN